MIVKYSVQGLDGSSFGEFWEYFTAYEPAILYFTQHYCDHAGKHFSGHFYIHIYTQDQSCCFTYELSDLIAEAYAVGYEEG